MIFGENREEVIQYGKERTLPERVAAVTLLVIHQTDAALSKGC